MLRSRRARSLLVLEADGCRLRGAVFARSAGEGVAVTGVAESSQSDEVDALRELIVALRAAGGDWPHTAAVITGEAVAATVRLPLPVGRPRRAEEMGELVRWELEPYFAQHTGPQPLGAILVRCGLLSEAKLTEVLEEQRHRKQDGARDRSRQRLGAVATDLGYVGAAGLDEALALQRRPVDAGGDFRCGWSARGNVDPGEANASLWFVTGLPDSSWRRWREALAEHGLALEGIYPLAGSASASVSKRSLPQRCALVEIDAGSVSCAELFEGEVRGFQELPRTDGEALERVVEDVLATVNGQPVFVAGADPARVSNEAHGIVPELSGESRMTGMRTASMTGVARHALGLAAPGAAVCVPGRAPRRALRSRPVVWWLSALAALALLLYGVDSLLVLRRAHGRDSLADAKAPLERADRMRFDEQTLAERSYALSRELDQARQESEAVRARSERLRRAMDDRCGLVVPMLDALARSIDGELVLERVESVAGGRVRVEGWAARERGIQHFTSKAATQAEPLGFRVERQAIRTDQQSRVGGYRFEFELAGFVREESE